MKLIQCKLGAAEPMVGGRPYAFTRDAYGRFVARVDDDRHVAILLAVEHYIEVPEIPAEHVAAAQPQQSPGQQPPPSTEPPAQTNPAAQFVDDVGLVKGIGPSVKEKLAAIGFVSLSQIAELTDEDVARLDTELQLRGGITRFAWREQAAALLAAAQPQQSP